MECKMKEFVSKNRSYLMGIAMLFVVVFHAFCWIYNPVGGFNIGYVGVDMFLFLSGFGLASSFEKNKLSIFYKNRLKRIYPMYSLAVLTTYLFLCQNDWGIDDLLYNLSSLGFYTKGGTQRYDWYLESLFTLYFLFPVFYHLSKLKYIALLFLFMLTVFVLYKYDVPWWYDCFIGRLPIFLYGIMFTQCYKSAKYIGALGVVLYIPCRLYVSQFLASSLLVIAIIFIVSYFIRHLNSSVNNVIIFIGKHSLEIYIVNQFIFWVMPIYTFTIVEGLMFYVLVQSIGAFLVIKINNEITKYLK